MNTLELLKMTILHNADLETKEKTQAEEQRKVD
jgi:hypothetical protein